MKSALRRISTLAVATATVAIGTFASCLPAIAASPFSQHEVDQNKFVAVASPIAGGSSHQLLVLEQVSNSRACWSESGNEPVTINPLLIDFDFTGICSRSTDSNGYSIRVNGEDLGLQYSLRIVERDGDMLLVGAPFSRDGDEIVIGHTDGATDGFAKIKLYDGWRFTKRMYDGRVLGHVYLTYEGDLAANPGTDDDDDDTGSNDGDNDTTYAFRDIANDIYADDIQEAVQLGFIAGFPEDGTFRPQASLTREQLVSIVLGALDELPGVNLQVPASTSSSPFRDVSTSRWSAAKIKFAQENNIVSGYMEDGTFRPAQPVTRAELMAVLRRAAEYAESLEEEGTELTGTQNPVQFSDTSSHWANSLINQMSSYCGVASPLNEQGNRFAPDQAAQRNYATAATLRMMNCVEGETETANESPQ